MKGHLLDIIVYILRFLVSFTSSIMNMNTSRCLKTYALSTRQYSSLQKSIGNHVVEYIFEQQY